LTKEEALELLSDNPFKVSLINAKIKDGDKTSAYRVGDFVDLCTGPHVDNSKKIKAISI
jgi:threonyl-tRNA synthetase